MKLSTLSEDLPKKKLLRDAEITGLCTDSRVAKPGDLFFCFRGTHTDAHKFAEEAAFRGAAVVTEQELPVPCAQLVVPDGREAMARLCAAFYRHPEKAMRFIGITGTNGKTTTSYMLANMLRRKGLNVAVIGTLGAVYGNCKIEPSLTTPDPAFLFSMLDSARKTGVQYVIMEVSAHALALKKECPIHYDIAIFTNLTRDHLDFFPSMEEYGAAKKSLFSRCKVAVLNADDPFSEILQKECETIVTYGLETPADAFSVIDEETLRRTKLLLNLSDELCEAQLLLTGRHNVYNALAASCAARILGVDCKDIAKGLEDTKTIDGRLEWVAAYHGADIFVDFAHTPDGLNKSLSALREHCKGNLVLLFGCGGNRDSGKRAEMGECAAKLCDFCIITSDNPRFEDPCAIIGEIEAGYRKVSNRYVTVEERKKATEYALEFLQAGDILLVAGKGGETYQEIMGIKYDYNDKTVIKSLIGNKS